MQCVDLAASEWPRRALSLDSAFDDAHGAEAGDLAGQAGVLAGTPVCTRHFAGLPPLFLRGRAMEGRYEADRLVVNEPLPGGAFFDARTACLSRVPVHLLLVREPRTCYSDS